MKGRSLPGRTHIASRHARLIIGALALLAPIAACGESSAAPAATETIETADDPRLETTTSASTPTVAATTTTPVVEPTAAPTTVETLPTPEAPPDPRADEPHIEMGSIEIPKIDIKVPLLRGISLTTLDKGPGYWPGTAAPGQLGNTVIAGHRTSHGKEFRNLDQLVPGDEVIFVTADGRFVYSVRETTIVKPDALYIIEQTYAKTATLFACHPVGSTRERIVVHLDLLTAEPATPEPATPGPADPAATTSEPA